MLFQKGIYDRVEDVQNNISMISEALPNPYEKNSGTLEFEVIPSDPDSSICTINYNSDMYRETSIRKFSVIFTQVVTLMLEHVEDKGFTFGMLREHLCKFR